MTLQYIYNFDHDSLNLFSTKYFFFENFIGFSIHQTHPHNNPQQIHRYNFKQNFQISAILFFFTFLFFYSCNPTLLLLKLSVKGLYIFFFGSTTKNALLIYNPNKYLGICDVVCAIPLTNFIFQLFIPLSINQKCFLVDFKSRTHSHESRKKKL